VAKLQGRPTLANEAKDDACAWDFTDVVGMIHSRVIHPGRCLVQVEKAQICEAGNCSRICGGKACGRLSEIGRHQDWEEHRAGDHFNNQRSVKIFPFGSWASNQGFRLGGDQSEGPVKRLVLAMAEMTNTPGRVVTLR
jgi:hypothetical protein